MNKQQFCDHFTRWGEDSATLEGLTLVIERDEQPLDPRQEWDNLGTMVCEHRRYNLGDENPNDIERWLRDEVSHHLEISQETLDNEGYTELLARFEQVAMVLPLYLYDHSGLSINTGGFSCRWDSGQVGFIYVLKDEARREWGWKRLTEARIQQVIASLNAEVEVYDHYLQGEVYCFDVKTPDGEVVESCCGFYGDHDKSGLIDELYSDWSWAVNQRKQQRWGRLKTMIRNRVPLWVRSSELEGLTYA